MSILLKALKQAEADRKVARPAQSAGARAPADARMGAGENPGGDILSNGELSAVPAHTASTTARQTYGGLWITLALAVASAAAFAVWMRGMSSARPPSAPAATMQTSAPAPVSMAAPSTTPAGLQMQEAGPLQLRLDRHLDTPVARAR